MINDQGSCTRFSCVGNFEEEGMAIIAKQGFPDHLSLSEREVGNARQRMIDCVCVTGYSPAGLLGTHISPGENEAELQETLRLLSMGGGKACTAWTLVGHFTKHLGNTRVAWWNTREKIAKALRASIGKGAVVELFDSGAMYAVPYGLGFDIVVSREPPNLKVLCRMSGSKYKDDPLVPVTGAARRI